MANGSIVDFLNRRGQDSSFQARRRLASDAGIENFTGTAAQNTQLLQQLQSGSPVERGTIRAENLENATPIRS